MGLYLKRQKRVQRPFCGKSRNRHQSKLSILIIYQTCTPSPLQICLGGMSDLLLVVPKGGCLQQMNLSLDVALVLAMVNWAWVNIRNHQLSPLKLPNWNMSMSWPLDVECLTASS